jgi:tetratricopeptide (TPR) repeat protein
MATLRLTHRPDATSHVIELALDGMGPRQTATARFDFDLTKQDREDVRWYLEDYLQYPLDPAPQIARRVESRLAALGCDLFTRVFEASPDAKSLWDAAAGSLSDARLEVAAGVAGSATVPWELLRDPTTDLVLALSAGAFVRTHSGTARQAVLPVEAAEALRVLLVICRPAGSADVPFRSVASHLVRLSSGARDAFQLDVLRPPTFGDLTQVLGAARAAGSPYHVVHFDGHGVYLDVTAAEAAGVSLVSPPRPGVHGFLVFEDAGSGGNQQLVDGPALGRLLVDTGVPVLVLNACRSAHADLVTTPEKVTAELDAHRRVRAYGSLAQEVMDAGVAGVVAMSYNVYVVTAAQFIGDVYAALLSGLELGAAVSAARKQLAADPLREVGGEPRALQDWLVPVVYEAAPMALRPAVTGPVPVIDMSQEQADRERARLDPALPAGPVGGFFGRDETLLALDRVFDTVPVALLHAWAGAGKSSAAVEFARWYALTGGAETVLFTSFTHYVPLARLLDQVGDRFGPALATAGVQWAALDEGERRDRALQILAQVPVLWVWDNVEPVAGFPVGALSAWTMAEQDELAGFLRELASWTRCKVLLTSRRDERSWLGSLPRPVTVPAMPMLERLELARAVATRQTGATRRFLEVEDWRPLLAFTQGNPLTVSILVRQALRDHRTTREQIEAFVADLSAGAARVTDDAAQGRGASLTASLDYGFAGAFTEDERAVIALLALFQGFVSVYALCLMGSPEMPDGPVPAVAGMTQAAGITLLDRAAEVGLLTAYRGGFYAVHPAVPGHLQDLLERHYGAPGSDQAMAAIHAWATAVSFSGYDYHQRYEGGGHAAVINVLGAEEANLLRARQLAIEHGWQDLLLGSMQGLEVLYGQTGRAAEWRRLVDELVPVLADPVTGGPHPGRELHWVMITGYRVRIAIDARDWPAAGQLQHAVAAWHRDQAADALASRPETLDGGQRVSIHNLAVALEHLGDILREQQDANCMQPYLEAAELCQRIGDRREEAIVAFNLGRVYQDVPGASDLDEAERWFRRASELFGELDTVGRAISVGALGGVAYARFFKARAAGADSGQLDRQLNDAASAYLRALKLTPTDDVEHLAAIHLKLGNIYNDAGDMTRALGYFQRAIRYEEGRGDRYRAGQTRYDIAYALDDTGRRHDALLYARAALRDLEAVGSGAVGAAEKAGQLIAYIEQELSVDHESDPDSPA